jgi:hypothetical protein
MPTIIPILPIASARRIAALIWRQTWKPIFLLAANISTLNISRKCGRSWSAARGRRSAAGFQRRAAGERRRYIHVLPMHRLKIGGAVFAIVIDMIDSDAWGL